MIGSLMMCVSVVILLIGMLAGIAMGIQQDFTLAPAHAPELFRRRAEIAESVAKAQAAVAAGTSNEKTTFDDINLGTIFQVTTTPAIYLSFFGPESPAVMPENAAHLTAPLLMVSGSDDPTQRNADSIFARVPFDPRNKHMMVEADHLGTPAASAVAVLSWLQMLERSGLDK